MCCHLVQILWHGFCMLRAAAHLHSTLLHSDVGTWRQSVTAGGGQGGGTRAGSRLVGFCRKGGHCNAFVFDKCGVVSHPWHRALQHPQHGSHGPTAAIDERKLSMRCDSMAWRHVAVLVLLTAASLLHGACAKSPVVLLPGACLRTWSL